MKSQGFYLFLCEIGVNVDQLLTMVKKNGGNYSNIIELREYFFVHISQIFSYCRSIKMNLNKIK